MSKSNRKAVFFIRAYNDMDHLTPVIWKTVTATDISVSVVIRMGKSLPDDYRLNFLRQFKQLEIRHITEFFGDDNAPVAPVSLISRVKQRLKLSSEPEVKRLAKGEIDPDNIETMLDDLFGVGDKAVRRGIVIFDWVNLSSLHRSFALMVKEAAKKRGYTNLSLPHGDSPYWNEMFKLEDIDYSAMAHFENNPLDVVVVPNQLTAKRYIPYRNEHQLKIIGSARYSDEWMAVMQTLIPDFNVPGTEHSLKIVMFLRNAVFPINWEQVIQSIRLIIQFPDVYLVVKHHTRGGEESSESMREHLELSKLNAMTAPNLKIVYNDTHSGSLLQWADAIVELGTSISFEAVKMNKPLLAAEFLHANVSTTAHYLPRTAMRCKDDLYDAVQVLREKRDTRLYNEEERQHFIQQITDYPDANVLGRYIDLITDLIGHAEKPMLENVSS